MTELLYPLYLSFKVAIASTILIFIFGIALSWLLARKNFFGKNFIDVLLNMPLVLPPTVVGFFLLYLLGKNGPIGKILAQSMNLTIVFTLAAAVIASFIMALPLMIRSCKAAFESVDVRLENAAKTLGASDWRVFLEVTLPLAWKGILAGLVMSFARSLGEFGATIMVAGNIPFKTQTAPLAIYSAFQGGNEEQAKLLVLFMTVLSFVTIWVVNSLSKGKDYANR
ncbi:MAG: molybdate ABC transporter permease subunit [Firmicutes bacterium]|nr:molybdate ABC transporter permease subunit [Bacillota bacterium]